MSEDEQAEPVVTTWRSATPRRVLELALGAGGTGPAARDRPHIVAVDGRSGSGKSTLADRLAATVPASAVVHLDDIAWQEPWDRWGDLAADGLLEPLRRGEPASFRPPAWEARGRVGAIELAAGLDLVVLEGVGAGQRRLATLLDAVVWVQTDLAEAEARGIARDLAIGGHGDLAATRAFWDGWMAAEHPFLDRERPWERAALVVSGSSREGGDDSEIAFAPGPAYVGAD